MVNDTPTGKSDKTGTYKDTLNLPHTDFPIRQNAVVSDSAMIDRWAHEQLDTKTFEQNKGKKSFILHDGPPYANGPLHLGHAYNKILKDVIAKSQRMQGQHVPVTPGWDCHGLPIELTVSKQLPELSDQALIKECRSYAQGWIDHQRESFKKLGIFADWNRPYLTMNPSYEASIMRAFAHFVTGDFVKKKKKTVPWCFSCQTVLASAEIEYQERKDPSIYVQFALSHNAKQKLLPQLADQSVDLLVWTTTPWTLPLNRAILIKPGAQYSVIKYDQSALVVATALVDHVCAAKNIEKNVLATIDAEDLAGFTVQHPFITSLSVPIILEHTVSLNDGTALVHCAPGCGPQDYDIAIKHNLEVYSPLSVDGKYTSGIMPVELEGMSILDGQIWVLKKLVETNQLFLKKSIKHSYPHCWRCRNGLMFRATQQWFCELEQNNLRQRALNAIEQITFLPPASKNFLKATIEGRLEWCISRQRVWGVPIPALLCTNCTQPYITPDLIEQVASQVEIHGVEYWHSVTVEQLLPESVSCIHCSGRIFIKEQDILDVWFDSGVSHYAVLRHNPELRFPADMYLEGVDQHRGWFQSSLLTSLVIQQQAATKAFLTHGFTVDQNGHKMSKSLGNVVSPEELIARLSTDGLRLWTMSINYEGDATVSDTLLSNVSHVFRKIRNTLRFLLSNIYDFNIDTDSIAIIDMRLVDRYALHKLYEINHQTIDAYNRADFTEIFNGLAQYCTTDLSAFYLDIIKDRLYVEDARGDARRAAQTVCWYILDTLTKLIAPILSITAEQVSDYYQTSKTTSIHLQNFNLLEDVWQGVSQETPIPGVTDASLLEGGQAYVQAYRQFSDETKKNLFLIERKNQWDLIFAIRSALLKVIEQQREKGLIKHPLEVRMILYFDFTGPSESMLNNFLDDVESTDQSIEQFFKELLVVSQVEIVEHKGSMSCTEIDQLYAQAEGAQGVKCPRCWHYNVSKHVGGLCPRCELIISKA